MWEISVSFEMPTQVFFMDLAMNVGTCGCIFKQRGVGQKNLLSKEREKGGGQPQKTMGNPDSGIL